MKKLFKDLKKNKVWQNGLMIVGFFSLLFLLVNLFMINRHPNAKEPMLEESLSATDGSLLPAMASLLNAPLVEGGTVEVLNNGDEFYPKLFADLQDAEHEIFFSAYIWKQGELHDRMFDLLIAKAEEGVQVRLLLDGFGAKTTSREKIKELEEAGGSVSWFHPLNFGFLTKYHERNHARAIIIDNVAYTGGMAVSDYWLGNADTKEHWRDMMFRFTGPLTFHSRNTFTLLWNASESEVLVTDGFTGDGPLSNLSSVSLTNLAPDEDIGQLATLYWSAIASAQGSILIATPYLVLDDDIQSALLQARDRGVTVSILLPGKEMDTKIVRYANHSQYGRLLRAGVRIYEYEPTMMHAKYFVVDEKLSVIGSSNIDTRSLYVNVENAIMIDDETLAQELHSEFVADMQKSREIKLEDWRKRNIFRRVLEFVVSLVDKQL